jgi:hypothetical protein
MIQAKSIIGAATVTSCQKTFESEESIQDNQRICGRV